jgi:hypothetical protein
MAGGAQDGLDHGHARTRARDDRLPRFETLDEEIDFATTKFGPLIMARPMLESAGRWEDLLDDMRRLLGATRPAEYLLIQGRKG